jgi:hypothetical protein
MRGALSAYNHMQKVVESDVKVFWVVGHMQEVVESDVKVCFGLLGICKKLLSQT